MGLDNVGTEIYDIHGYFLRLTVGPRPQCLGCVCLFMYKPNHLILMPLLESYNSPIMDQNLS